MAGSAAARDPSGRRPRRPTLLLFLVTLAHVLIVSPLQALSQVTHSSSNHTTTAGPTEEPALETRNATTSLPQSATTTVSTVTTNLAATTQEPTTPGPTRNKTNEALRLLPEQEAPNRSQGRPGTVERVTTIKRVKKKPAGASEATRRKPLYDQGRHGTGLAPFPQDLHGDAPARVKVITAECHEGLMRIQLGFNGSFLGLVYSTEYAHDPDCVYVNGTGRASYQFQVRVNRCGTLGRTDVAQSALDSPPGTAGEKVRGQQLWNSLTVQYNRLIEEDADERFRVTCEYAFDYWKTVNFPLLNVEVNTGVPVVFTLPPPQCSMEVRLGFGLSGPRAQGPVTVGDPLTLVVTMTSVLRDVDILVSNCVAHNGADQKLQLVDVHGCTLQDKLLSAFRGSHSSRTEGGQQVTLFAFLKAFRFTGSRALYVECDVHMCHGSCPTQQCSWRHLEKRSVDRPENETSFETLNLFHALEVLHSEVDAEDHSPLSESGASLVCLKTSGFAAAVSLLLLTLVLCCLLSVCTVARLKSGHAKASPLHEDTC